MIILHSEMCGELTDTVSSLHCGPNKSDWFESHCLNSDIEGMILPLLSTADLNRLSLLSKATRAAAEPYLYSHLDWTWTGPTPPPVIPFTRTILSRQNLATFVKRLTLSADRSYLRDGSSKHQIFIPQRQPESQDRPYSTCCRCRVCFKDSTVHRPRPQQLQLHGFDPTTAAEALRMTGVSQWENWLRALEDGDFDAFLALLLSQLCNLRDFYIDPHLNWGRCFVSLFFRSALLRQVENDQPHFDRLRCVSYNQICDFSLDECIRDRVDHFTQLFQLPSVQYLSLSLDHARHIDWSTKGKPIFSTITHLEISDVRERHLFVVLDAVPHLKSLRWALYHRPRWEDALINLATVNSALERVSGTLEDLTISARNVCGNNLWEEPLTFEGSLSSLRRLQRLRRLTAPYAFLASGFYPTPQVDASAVIPLDIHELTLTYDLYEQEWGDESNNLEEDDHPRDNELLATWVAAWFQEIGRGERQLRKVSIVYPWDWEDKVLDEWTPGEEEEWDVVKTSAVDIGIELVFSKPLQQQARLAAFRRFDDFSSSTRA